MAEDAEKLKRVLFDSFAPAINLANNAREYTRRTFAHKLTFVLTGNLDVGVVAATLNEDGILNFIRRAIFTLLADVNVFSVSGQILHRINAYVSGEREQISQPAVVVGANAFRITMDMPFIMEDFPLGEGFKLNTAQFRGQRIQDPKYNIRLGVASDIATPGGGGTVAVSGLNIDWYTKEEQLDTSRENEIREEIQVVEDLVVATTAAGLVDVQDNNILRRLSILAKDNGTGLLDDTVIDRIRLIRDSDTTRREFKWRDLQDINKFEYGIDDGLFAAISPGFAILNLDEDFDLSGVIDTRESEGVKTLDLEIVPVAGKTARVSVSKEVILVKQ